MVIYVRGCVVLCCVLFLKGETYKLFWPEKAEFVRMAARYGVTIIPFASVGEDELLEVLFLILKSLSLHFFFPLENFKKNESGGFFFGLKLLIFFLIMSMVIS
jgi:1-acyl-sn-glycerol-3-phosphate acyltransferase